MAGFGRRKGAKRDPLDDEAASGLEQLYRRHAAWLSQRLAARFRTTPLDVDDLASATWERASRYAPEDSNRSPRALLMTIAVNLARDHMRRNVVRGGLAVPLDEVDEARLGVEQADQAHLLELKRVVLALPPIYRDVFVLARFTGLTYEEIASHIGIPVKTVESRMSKALAMCAAQLRD